ncbi:hypothetical protein BC828DRAFT_402448 [Blastocladiella britannica]|nr:hypothetical protein BC828DRAFT_402448 [Blastocladiella britannica]
MTSALGFLDFLDDPELGDCSFLIGNSTAPICASKMLLVRASPFFYTLLTKTHSVFIETTALQANEPIRFADWSLPAFLLALVHIYCGWLPGNPLPAQTNAFLAKHRCVLSDFDFLSWQAVYQLARMLELDQFAVAINLVLVDKLAIEHLELTAKIKKPSATETRAVAAAVSTGATV